MSAIYQTARPQTFKQVIGQEHVIDILAVALKRDRIGHAYLFSGPRGVGKTTTARLLAMAVNCESESKPCGQCESCQLIKNGNHPDVIELDAASNNSVEDIRDLREKVRLASMRGGKRVWVLDEAHMLSRAASNALLKTLEEPPEKLVFILATTEPEKLPATILSRCQHFRFRRLSEDEIKSKLIKLCQTANVEADEEALLLVAKSADGAMRDAESFLERLLASGEKISLETAEDALGLPPQEQMQKLASLLTKQDLGKMLELAAELYHQGFAPSSLLMHLTKTMRDALANKVLENDAFKLEIEQKDELRVIHALDDEMERFTRRDNLFGLELALIKAINTLTNNRPDEQVNKTQNQRAQNQSTKTAKTIIADFDPSSKNRPTNPRPAIKQAASPSQNKAESNISWYEVQKNAAVQLKAFLMPAQVTIDGKIITLFYKSAHSFHYEQVLQREDSLLELVHKLYGNDVQLVIKAEGKVGKKKPLSLHNRFTADSKKPKTTGKAFIEPKSKKTVVKLDRLEPELTTTDKNQKNNKTQPPNTSADIPKQPESSNEAVIPKEKKSLLKDIKAISEFPDDIPPDFWNEQEELADIEELSKYNQLESFDSSFETSESTTKENKIAATTSISKSSEELDKPIKANALNNKKASPAETQNSKLESNKNNNEEEKLEVSYPLFAEVEKLFPGKIIKIEPKAD